MTGCPGHILASSCTIQVYVGSQPSLTNFEMGPVGTEHQNATLHGDNNHVTVEWWGTSIKLQVIIRNQAATDSQLFKGIVEHILKCTPILHKVEVAQKNHHHQWVQASWPKESIIYSPGSESAGGPNCKNGNYTHTTKEGPVTCACNRFLQHRYISVDSNGSTATRLGSHFGLNQAS